MTRLRYIDVRPVLVIALAIFLFPGVMRGAEKTTVRIEGTDVLPANGSITGTWFYAGQEWSTQLLLLGHANAGPDASPNYRLYVDLAPNETAALVFPDAIAAQPGQLSCNVVQLDGSAEILWQAGTGNDNRMETSGDGNPPALDVDADSLPVALTFRAGQEGARLHVDRFSFLKEGIATNVNLDPVRRPRSNEPVLSFPDLKPFLAQALVEWDWRMQDGIETPLLPVTFRAAVAKRLPQVELLLSDLRETYPEKENFWNTIGERLQKLTADVARLKELADTEPAWSELWRNLHTLRREALLANPQFETGALVFAKHIPSALSHQLEQEYGYLARPGGGIFVLKEPGRSMKTERLDHDMPMGNYKHPSVTWDGKKIYFSFCEAVLGPSVLYQEDCMSRKYHIWSMNADGSDLKQITSGDVEDFAPMPLPDGDVIFVSTRRGGFHRCGGGPCPVYTLAKMTGEGDDPHLISFHETQEWNPSVLHDGRVLYTRWDYVDRDASFYQNLWTTRQDGTDVRIFYGNNTFSPHGIWEAKPVPDSNKVIGIAGPHHSLSAGSVLMIDPLLGVDGPEPVTRITPEVVYPESEIPLPMTPGLPAYLDFDQPYTNGWYGNIPYREADRVTEIPEEEQRWPLHCFKSPWPLSEKYFIASYSFDKLVGEMGGNIANQFGLYFCDAFGTRELIYRDPNVSSVWATPLTERKLPSTYVSTLPPRDEAPSTGRFYVQNVYESWPYKIPETVRSLRVVQVLPKTTPNANQPKVGLANASPGKQVLGTVPVEEDGSVYFEAPAQIPMLFQLLDEHGRMVQGMRSLVYLQPGEVSSCTGCHENRMSVVPSVTTAAYKRDASIIRPGPDGSKPFSYPILVQPVLDRLCVECHNDTKAEGNINLTSGPDGTFSKSYNALMPFVAYTAWGLPEGNHEPYTKPDQFGARASQLTQLLLKGHYECELTEDDWNRLNTWMDTNALFYGTFQPERQQIQLNGGRLDGPDLE
ncbi:MAG: hypothetical protein Q4G68_12970 [Planctomycetia bacterium]|nr:hypothetical protein [Planctomycetia bacterium]